jgi:heat shock protein HtpX
MYQEISANRQRTFFLFLFFLVLVIGLGYLFALVLKSSVILWVAVAFSLISAWAGYFYSDRLALAVSGARPIRKQDFPDLVRVVENLAIADGIPTPKIYVIDDPSPNAFATGRNYQHAAIAVTSGLLSVLDKTELEGVIAHELSHIKNYDILVATAAVVLAGMVAMASDFFLRINFWRGGRNRDENQTAALFMIIGLALAILAPIFATLMQLAISRRREFLADASGALLTRYPEGLISALQKISKSPQPLRRVSRATAHLFIVNPLGKLGRGMATLWSTHPPIEARIEKLRKMEI